MHAVSLKLLNRPSSRSICTQKTVHNTIRTQFVANELKMCIGNARASMHVNRTKL